MVLRGGPDALDRATHPNRGTQRGGRTIHDQHAQDQHRRVPSAALGRSRAHGARGHRRHRSRADPSSRRPGRGQAGHDQSRRLAGGDHVTHATRQRGRHDDPGVLVHAQSV